jgi:tRNA(His) 5'-end guanylyltransferase
MIQDMLHEQKGINWNDFPTHKKRGTCVIKKMAGALDEFGAPVVRSQWVVDTEIPIFKGEDRKYIDRLICVGECQCNKA